MKTFSLAILLLAGTALGCASDAPRTLPEVRTFATMVQAGNYQRVSKRVTPELVSPDARFDAAGLAIRQFEQELSTEEILSALAADRQVPGTLADLMAYNVAYPEAMRCGAVTALGSTWRGPTGSRYQPSAYEDEHGNRTLYLAWDDAGDRWDTRFKFLVRQQ